MQEFENGLIGIWEKTTDFIMWSENIVAVELLKKEVINRQPVYEYNQGAQYETRNYCTIYSAITELSYLFDREFSLDEIKEIANRMIKDGKLDPSKWAYLSDAIDYTRKWWNEMFPEQKVESYRFSYLDKEITDILTHSVVRLTQIGYRTSSELRKELETEGFAMKKDYPKKWWHAVSQYWLNTIDNYKWKKKHNRYSFEHITDLINNWVIFEHGYLFLKV